MPRNGSDMDMRAVVGALTVRQHVCKFAGQAQSGTVAAMVKTYTISIV